MHAFDLTVEFDILRIYYNFEVLFLSLCNYIYYLLSP